MALTNEEYVAKGGNICPHCGSTDIVGGSDVEIGTGTAMQGVSCSECGVEWVDQYKLVGYVATALNSNNVDSIEYSVCEDCLLYISHAGDETEDGETEHIGKAIQRELGGRTGHFNVGVEPTEDDPEGNGYEEFSSCECELCRSHLGGSRHGVTLLFTK